MWGLCTTSRDLRRTLDQLGRTRRQQKPRSPISPTRAFANGLFQGRAQPLDVAHLGPIGQKMQGRKGVPRLAWTDGHGVQADFRSKTIIWAKMAVMQAAPGPSFNPSKQTRRPSAKTSLHYPPVCPPGQAAPPNHPHHVRFCPTQVSQASGRAVQTSSGHIRKPAPLAMRAGPALGGSNMGPSSRATNRRTIAS